MAEIENVTYYCAPYKPYARLAFLLLMRVAQQSRCKPVTLTYPLPSLNGFLRT